MQLSGAGKRSFHYIKPNAAALALVFKGSGMDQEQKDREQFQMTHAAELASGQRFEFGRNWAGFLSRLTEVRIQTAEDSLRTMLELDTLAGKSFLDAGSGSGLFSLAAKKLGARVHSFDYDSKSVACTAELKRRFFPADPGWVVEEGSVLDKSYLESLGEFDIVYSWGVLHHTGNMYQAIKNAAALVADNGKLFIAIYNDSAQSKAWKWVKRQYCRLPRVLKAPFAVAILVPQQMVSLIKGIAQGKPGASISYIVNYRQNRGMSWWHDQIDWIGGYPYEYAKPEEIFRFLKERGFRLDRLTTVRGGTGCNQFVFTKLKI